jgi:hypothetical protein
MAIHRDWKEFIELLNAHHVDYLVVGGVAFACHAYPRFTGDLDVFIRRSPENAEAMARVLDSFGFHSLGLTSEDFLRQASIVQLGARPLRIDIINVIDGVTFDEAWQGRLQTELDGTPVAVIGKADLIRNKQASGRERDRLDVEDLLGQ